MFKLLTRERELQLLRQDAWKSQQPSGLRPAPPLSCQFRSLIGHLRLFPPECASTRITNTTAASAHDCLSAAPEGSHIGPGGKERNSTLFGVSSDRRTGDKRERLRYSPQMKKQNDPHLLCS